MKSPSSFPSDHKPRSRTLQLPRRACMQHYRLQLPALDWLMGVVAASARHHSRPRAIVQPPSLQQKHNALTRLSLAI
jgi:hypothetical protein